MLSSHLLRKLLFTALLAGLVLTGIPPAPARAAGEFTHIGAVLPGVDCGAAAWGDYDNDGDLDLLLAGDTGSGYITRVYRNDGGTFTDIVAGLQGISSSSVAWGDYDNDGDLDVLIAGQADAGNRITQVHRNDGGDAFTDIAAGLPGVSDSAVAWGDYDNDGDLDILLTGYTSSGYIARVYRNDGGTFTDIAAVLPGVSDSAVAWGDYDNDGDLDILLTGYTGWDHIARVYRNNGNDTFTDIASNLPGIYRGSAAWGDYDNDGDLDILLTGYTGWDHIARVYRNNGNDTFTDIAKPACRGLSTARPPGATMTMTATWTSSSPAAPALNPSRTSTATTV